MCVLISYFESSLYQTRSVAGHVGCKIGLVSGIKDEGGGNRGEGPHLDKLPSWEKNTAGGPGMNRIATPLLSQYKVIP